MISARLHCTVARRTLRMSEKAPPKNYEIVLAGKRLKRYFVLDESFISSFFSPLIDEFESKLLLIQRTSCY